LNFLAGATRNLMFTGKGGVGKTSVACASAISLAERGRRVLLVSTDPASNLDEVLETRLESSPVPVQTVKGLWAMNVDPEEAAAQYRQRALEPYRELLPKSALDSIEEQLSGACTVEIAAFDEFAKLLGDPLTTAQFEHVIFDTAPTGHTLRLLKLPAAWTGFIASNVGGTSCLGPLAGLEVQRGKYERTLESLSDPTTTTVFLVSRPETSALAEAERTSNELSALGLKNQRLILNGMFRAQSKDPIARALEKKGCEALAQMPGRLALLPRTEIPLAAESLIGVDALRRMGQLSLENTSISVRPTATTPPPAIVDLVPDLVASGRGVIMTMGKGGVGKTTVAAALAVEIAGRGHPVHLTTTDPAAHLEMALDGQVPGLRISRIDPVAETRAYREEVMAEAGGDLDEKGRALLEEDLRSPCTEEIAVFRAFARIVDEGNAGFVVIDTAPTGHTLLLLDAADAYHREVSRNLNHIPDGVRRLLPQLRDPDFTRIILVTLPEATPVHEAARLQEDLKRAEIAPFAWIVNQSFSSTATLDPVLLKRGALELAYISEVRDRLAGRMALIPWQAEPPVGVEGLERLFEAAVTR